MRLIINGQEAAIKSNSSFDYVSENRAFSDADDYTLSITLPLSGCPANIAIFGHIDRMDSNSRNKVMEATIIDNAFSRHGVITVVEADEIEIKCQFLEGRSVQNFMTTFDDIYINELQLGSYPSASLPSSVSYGDIDHNADCVALPWVNDSSNGYMNNEVIVEDGVYKWSESTKNIGKLSYMPYLITIAKRICEALPGYTYDFSAWENSDERYLLICNALPASWNIPQFARALPHWTVSEFFSELEKILVCEINIDHRSRHIGLTFSKDIYNSRPEIKLENVLDSFTSEISYEDDICQFKGIANLRYADRGDTLWKIDQCQWLVDLMKTDGKHYIEFETEEDFDLWWLSVTNIFGYCLKDEPRGENAGMLVYAKYSDTYKLFRVVPDMRYFTDGSSREVGRFQLMNVNRFGDVIKQPDSDNSIQLSMLPVRIDETDAQHGRCIFLSPSGFDEKEELDSYGIRQPTAYSTLLKGEPDSAAEYYDKIYLAYWDGHSDNQQANIPPVPYVDERFSLSRRYKSYLSGIAVNPREKLKISWLDTRIPEVRAIFHIRGKRYLCEKITATFTEDGMSQLLKGEFYPII